MNTFRELFRSPTLRGFLILTLLWGLVLFSPDPPRLRAQGQATNASLGGTVLDNSGATIPGALVTLSSEEKGISRNFTTTTDGHYAFTLVPPGNYTMRVEKEGFQTYNQRGITLAIGQSARQDVTLQLGSITQQVEVTGSASLLNTANANLESEVTSQTAVELPLNWRNVFSLVTLDSSVNNSAQSQALGSGYNVSDQDVAFFNFGGGRFGTTAFLLDGHWDGTGDWDGIIFVPGVDEIQEFKIQTHSFTAQYGWSMGNIVNAVTKSGTSAFHGNVFEFLRNSALDANNFFNNLTGLPKPAFKRNQFGATAGGPLYIPGLYEQRNKTFIFGAYEGLRLTTPNTLLTTIPTAAMRTGNLSALLGSQIGTDALGRPVYEGAIYDPFSTRAITQNAVDSVTGLTSNATGYIRDPIGGTAGNGWVPTNVIPGTMIDPIAQNLIPFWPDPINSGLTDNFAGSASLPEVIDRWSIRGDHNLSDASRLFGRWSDQRLNRTITAAYFGADNPAGPASVTPNDRWDAGAGFTHVFSPTLVMNVVLGYNWWGEGFTPQGFGFQPSSIGFPSFLNDASVFPAIGIQGQFGLGAGNYNITPRYNITGAVDFTKVRGSHTLNTGFMWVSLYQYTTGINPAVFNFDRGMTSGPDPTTGDPRTGFGFGSFLLGTGTGGDWTLRANAAFIKKFVGGYFQDDWKVSRKLSLSLGVRYDIQTAPTDRFDRLSRFQFGEVNPLSSSIGRSDLGHMEYVGGGTSRGVYERQNTNIAPRLGMTYQLTKNLIMRGGFGIFYIPAMEDGDYQGLDLYGFSQTTPWIATVDGITPVNLLGDAYPNGLIQPVGKADGALTNVGLSTNAIEPVRPTPYAEQWMYGFQYQFAPNDSVEVSYIGNHGLKLLYGSTSVQKNALTPEQMALGNALLTSVANPFFGSITTSGCGLDQPTVPQQQLLRPYPQYCNVRDVQLPGGSSWYNALQVNYNHRFSQGLHLLASFTISKYLDTSSGPEQWASVGFTGIANHYNLAAEKSLNFNDIPKSLVVSYVYELPYGRGKKFGSNINTVANAVAGGWQVSGISTFKDGFPLAIGAVNNNTNSLGGAQRPDVIGDPAISNPTREKWLNTDAFAQPAAFTFGNGPRTYSNVRSKGIHNWDLGIQKWWNWRDEKLRIQFRAEMYNTFNQTYLFAPDVGFGSSTFGEIFAAGPSRSIQMGLKIYW